MSTLEPTEFGSLRAALVIADQVATTLGGLATDVELNTLTQVGVARISTLPLDRLQAIVDHGHVVEVAVRSEDWSLDIRWQAGG